MRYPTFVLAGLLAVLAPAAAGAQTSSEAEALCQSSDVHDDAPSVVTYCTKTSLAYARQARDSKSPSYRDRAQITMAVLAIKIGLAYNVLANEAKSREWTATAKRLLTSVAQHGSTAPNRRLAKRYLSGLDAPN